MIAANMHNDTASKELACIVCGNTTLHPVVYEKRGYPIRRCIQCKLGRTEIPEDFNPGSLYDASYFAGGQTDGYANYVASEAILRAEFREVLQELDAIGANRGRLLEIGCAYGFFLIEAQRSFDVVGIEIADDAVAFCRSRGLDVHQGGLSDELLRNQGQFDVVVMLDVIEHLPDPESALRIVRRHLLPGGHLVLTTGDWMSLISRISGRYWRLMTPPQHLFFFSPNTLASLLTRVGFHSIRCTHPWKRVPLRLALFQALRAVGLQRLLPRSSMLDKLGIPVNLFDAMRIVATRSGED
jgi:2-polyprenyl-3-methyl-5-hydroxy-6-metoxy-1,4-benzoquinol methylase